ncbi:MAG: PilZ domain-containing protein [Deltaproteobacteria bacterium]|nr:PilZ domain-containing protein [Deltaproteobacteria bacterium]
MTDDKPTPSPADEPTNRRQSFRIAIQTPVTVEYSGGVIDGSGADFSDCCMLVLADHAPAVDAEVTLRCVDDAGKQVTLHGRVLRHHQPDGDLKGFVIIEKQ